MIGQQGEKLPLNALASFNPRRVLLLADDPIIESVVESVCDKYEWTFTVIREGYDNLLSALRRQPKLLVLGFTLGDEHSLAFLHDLYATYPDAPLAVITGDSPGDVADVIGLAGGSAVLAESTALSERAMPKRKAPAWAELVSELTSRSM